MYGIYSIYNDDILIYIGKTNNFYTRLKTHMAQQPWKNEITHISIAKCKTKVDMDLYEKYYINKLSPIYNKAIVYNEIPTFAVEELRFEMFTLENFLNINKPKNLKNNNINKSYELRKKEIEELLKTSIEIKENEKINFIKSNSILYHWWDSLKTEISFLHVEWNSIFFKHILESIKNKSCKLIDYKYVFVFNEREELFKDFDLYSLGLTIDSYSISEKRISKGFSGINFVSGMIFDPKTKDVTVSINKYILDEYFNKYFIY